MLPTRISNLRIVTETGVIENGSLVMAGGQIAAVFDYNDKTVGKCMDIDGAGLTAVPGYIDTHCHGGNGFDANDGTPASIEGMTAFYAKHGITSYYPSLASDSVEALTLGFEAIRAAMQTNEAGKPEVLGTHLEGPFIGTKYLGSQAPENIMCMEDRHLLWIDRYKDVIRRITLAPEAGNNMHYIAPLCDMGIVVSGGHSDATYAQAVKAVEQGITAVTHLYNAMSQTRKEGVLRVCGLMEAGLTIDALYAEIIADGYHLPAPLIEIAYRCKQPDKLLVCSDANRAAGSKHGDTIHSCGQVYIIENGMALNSARTSLAASITPLDDMVRFLITSVGLPLHRVMQMVSAVPARMMGIYNRKGSIAIDKDADINLLDSNYRVVHSFCKGVQVL